MTLTLVCAACGDLFEFNDVDAMENFKKDHDVGCIGSPGDLRSNTERLMSGLSMFVNNLPEGMTQVADARIKEDK